jgi:hypothetical protein
MLSTIEPSTLIISGIFIVIVVIIIIFVAPRDEKFDPDYKTNNETYIQSNMDIIGDGISNGTVQKYNINGVYKYELVYDLPNSFSTLNVVNLGETFNKISEKQKYHVFAGDSRKYVGDLERRGDGYHTLEFNSDVDYKNICVTLGDSIISCLDI